MPPSDYLNDPTIAAAPIVLPYTWLKVKAIRENLKPKDDPKSVEGYRVLGMKE